MLFHRVFIACKSCLRRLAALGTCKTHYPAAAVYLDEMVGHLLEKLCIVCVNAVAEIEVVVKSHNRYAPVREHLHELVDKVLAGEITCHEHNAVYYILFNKSEDILLALLNEIAAVKIESHEEGQNIVAQLFALLRNSHKNTVHVVVEHISSNNSYCFFLLHSAHLPFNA